MNQWRTSLAPDQRLAPSRQHSADAPAGQWVRKRSIGARPRVEALPSVAERPNERWSTDLCRVWAGKDGWATLALVMDCHTRELFAWHLSRSGKATTAVSALEHALIARFGTLGRVDEPFLLRSDNGLVFTSRAYTKLVRSYGLKQEFITPHCPQQNGMMERLILVFPHRSGPSLCLGKRRKTMANKRPKPEEIVTKLRQVEILTGQGMPRLDAIRQIGVTEQTYYRWSAGG